MALKRGGTPLYYQLREMLRGRILQGEYPPETQLPTEAELCQEFGVSLTTIRRALADLTRDGLVVRTSGKGTFVQKGGSEWDIGPLASFSQEMQRRNLTPRNRIIRAEVIAPPSHVAEMLGDHAAGKVFCLERLRLVDNNPLMLECAYLPAERFPGMEKIDWEVELSLLRVLLETYRPPIIETRDVVEPALVTERQAGLLEVEPFSLALHLDTRLFTFDEAQVHYSSAILPARRSRYLVRMSRTPAEGGDNSVVAGRSFTFVPPSDPQVR